MYIGLDIWQLVLPCYLEWNGSSSFHGGCTVGTLKVQPVLSQLEGTMTARKAAPMIRDFSGCFQVSALCFASCAWLL